MAALIETVAEKPGHPILDAADPACPDGKAIARHLGHSWEAVLLDDSAPESPGGRPWDRLPPVVLDTTAARALANARAAIEVDYAVEE